MAITRTGAIPTWTLPDRLAKARNHAGIEQEELAQAMGVSRQSISNWERGYAKPKRPYVWAWADVTGVDRHWLLWGEEPPDDDGGAPPAGLEPATHRLTAGRSKPGHASVPDSWVHEFRKMVKVGHESITR